MHKSSNILSKALKLESISISEAIHLYNNCSLTELMLHAHVIRKKIHKNNIVSFIIDRNINYTNECISHCLFCNFCAKNNKETFILQQKDYISKIDELYSKGGRQILLQGGLSKKAGLNYIEQCFKFLKNKYPDIKLHALSPSEICFFSKQEKTDTHNILIRLKKAGLDSLPGGGAEILADRVRNILSPNKCTTNEWLEVMHNAHKLNITTSATMMFGHIETLEERIRHLFLLKELQSKKPEDSKGFISFTLWPLARENTLLLKKYPEIKPVYATEYLKMLAISRIILNNIPNIQASWLTVGSGVAKLCLFAGANDLSSIMIEENVLSSAGNKYKMNKSDMINCISEAGFTPKQRNQEYEYN